MKKLVTPILNINGNTSGSLVEPLRDVLIALEAAQAAFAAASDVTHGRNFQTHSDGWVTITRDASQAWGERRKMLTDLHQEVLELALAIQAQDRKAPQSDPTETAFMAFWRANKEAYATFGEAQDAWRMIQQQ